MAFMSSNIRSLTGKNVVPGGGGSGGGIVDRFAQVSAVAQPTLDAVLKLREVQGLARRSQEKLPNRNDRSQHG